MHKHIIYITKNKYKDLLSSYLAHAFAKYRYDNGKTTFLVQKGVNNNPLYIVSDADTLQIFLTNMNLSLYDEQKLMSELDKLIVSLVTDGFSSKKCTIRLYTLESNEKDYLNSKKPDVSAIFANEIMKFFPGAEYTIEWHIIKKTQKSLEEDKSEKIVETIFNSSITFQKMILTGKNQTYNGIQYTNIKNYYPDYDLEKIH